jgi:hypothetical protein
MLGAWSLWQSPHQKPRGVGVRLSPAVCLAAVLSLLLVPALALAQQPVPIPSFDPPPTVTKNSPPATAPATIPPASGTAVVIPATPTSDPSTDTPAFQQPPSRAQVKLDSAGLSIRARNSSLSQILRDVASASGMKVDGFSRDERVFGNFGPDEPHRVLSNLLDGSGYNVIMVGNTDKATPKVLSLSPRTQPGQPDVAPEPPTLTASPDDDGEQMTDDPADQQPETSIPANIPPGAPSPDSAAQAPAPDSDTPNVRTPQQILEDLQRIHPPTDQPQTPASPPSPQQ